MWDDIIKATFTAILSWGGGWVLAVLSFLVIVYMDKRIKELHTKCDEQREAGEIAVKEQYEKRLSEFKELVSVIERSTAALTTMKVSIDNRTETINQIVTGFANLVKDLEINRERWKDRGEAWSRQLDDIRTRVEALQRGFA
jgi:Na+-transporting methylmalonyl-CoA/oxaloacetate decarboxylase gamma subunit